MSPTCMIHGVYVADTDSECPECRYANWLGREQSIDGVSKTLLQEFAEDAAQTAHRIYQGGGDALDVAKAIRHLARHPDYNPKDITPPPDHADAEPMLASGDRCQEVTEVTVGWCLQCVLPRDHRGPHLGARRPSDSIVRVPND
jgi:hypothetical protein